MDACAPTGRRLLLAVCAAAIAIAIAIAWWRCPPAGTATPAGPTAAWTMVHRSDLAKDGARGLVFTAADVFQAETAPEPGPNGVRLPGAQCGWIESAEGAGDLRVTAVVRWIGFVDGFELLLGVPRVQLSAFWNVPAGVSCQFGGYQGSETYVAVNREAGFAARLASVHVPLAPDRDYRLVAERSGGDVILSVDGAEVYRHREILPIGDASHRHVAVRAFGPVVLRELTVERRPGTTGGLAGGDALAGAGHAADARQAYLAAAADPALAEEALARAYLAGLRAGLPHAQILPDLDRLLAAHPASAHRRTLEEARTLAEWRAGQTESAVQRAEGLLAAGPSRIALEMLAQRPRGLPLALAKRLLALVPRSPATSRLDLAGLGLEDIAPLKGLALRSLDLAGNRLRDLTPLAGMPLDALDLSDNPVEDLRPLAGLPLRQLTLTRCPIADLAPLAGLKALRDLVITGTRVADLAPLAGLPLQSLHAAGTQVADLTPLAKVRTLAGLRIDRCPVSDLTPLAGLPLTWLTARATRVNDLRPLIGSPLAELDLTGTGIADLTPLAGLPLRKAVLRGNRISDLRPLAGRPLEFLDLCENPIADLAPLAGITGGLRLSGCPAADLAPLAGSGLRELWLMRMPVTDLRPLAGLALRTVRFETLLATDLTPLHGLPLEEAQLARLPAAAIASLAEAQYRRGARPAVLRALWAQSALAANEPQRLRAMAQRLGGCDRLDLGLRMPLAEVRALAAACGARLVCTRDQAELQAVRAGGIGTIPFWLDVRRGEDGAFRWADGVGGLPPWLEPAHDPSARDGFAIPALGLGDYLLTPALELWPVGEGDSGVVLEWPAAAER